MNTNDLILAMIAIPPLWIIAGRTIGRALAQIESNENEADK